MIFILFTLLDNLGITVIYDGANHVRDQVDFKI